MNPYTPPNDTDPVLARIERLERAVAFARRAVYYRWFFGVVLVLILLCTEMGNTTLHHILMFLNDVMYKS